MVSRVGNRLLLALVLGAIIGAVVAVAVNSALGTLTGIAAVGVLFVTSGFVTLWPMDSADTRRHAGREDFPPVVEELLIVVLAVAALVTIIVTLLERRSGTAEADAALALGGVASSWAMLHLMYTARYAYHYYREPAGAIDFNGPDDYQPSYRDFFYFSFNLGMTYQVSDTNVASPVIRPIVLRHCLLSYAFGTGILATAINLVLGIVTG